MLATATGLVGKMTQTVEGPMFLAIMPGIIDRIGPYPHTALRKIRGLEKTWAASQLVVSRETWAEWLSRMTSIAVSAG
jgi:hypothetical protein